MRIADVLRGDVDDGEDAISSRSKFLRSLLFSCNSRPKLSFSKLKEKRGVEYSNSSMRKDSEGEPFDSVRDKTDVELESKTKPLMDGCSSGQHVKDVSFTLGLGVGLALFNAASKKELHRMVKLRSEMEIFFKEFKDEIQKNGAVIKQLELNDTIATSYSEVGSVNDQSSMVNCMTSHLLEESKTTIESDRSLKCDTHRREDCIPEIDQLEAEVEAELERLQLRLDVEEFSEHLQKQWSEAQTLKNGAHKENLFGCLEDPNGEEQQHGVCPNELERRLHELMLERRQERMDVLDSSAGCSSFGEGGLLSSELSPNILERRLHELLKGRQQERINELESALEHANHKLRQKEMEVSWWKDIAELISQHVTEAIHLSK